MAAVTPRPIKPATPTYECGGALLLSPLGSFRALAGRLTAFRNVDHERMEVEMLNANDVVMLYNSDLISRAEAREILGIRMPAGEDDQSAVLQGVVRTDDRGLEPIATD